jgi:hypothetical protein
VSSKPTSTRLSITPSDFFTDVAGIQLIINTALSGLRTSIPVKVLSVSNSGGLSPVGTLSVQPLVSSIDSSGIPWSHGTIYNVPYMRIQGGSNGIILDPAVGDIGIATVCDRDISGVKNTGKVSAPASNRKNDLSDMVYLMTIIGAAPTQYVQFNSSGITILSPTKVTITAPNAQINASTACNVTTANMTIDASSACTINAPSIVLNGAISQTGGGAAQFSGSMTVTGDVSAQGTSVHTHRHSGVTPGGGDTGAPI